MESHTGVRDRTICDTCHRPLGLRHSFAHLEGHWEHYEWDNANHAPNPRQETAKDKVLELCDFCGAPEVGWHYACRTFTFGQDVMVDGWAACCGCSTLIEQKSFDDLARRALRNQTKPIRDIAFPMTRRLHRAFVSNRIGGRVRAHGH